MSYSGVASRAGSPGASRAVGTLMSRNPNPGSAPGKVPCHRVVRSDGSPGNFTSEKGPEEKLNLLRSEGIEIKNGRIPGEFYL